MELHGNQMSGYWLLVLAVVSLSLLPLQVGEEKRDN